jgi:transcriptional regulator
VFVPSHYRDPDGAWTAETVRANPLALLVSNGAEGASPFATHLPIIMADPAATELTGSTLFGHLNRANPHWKALRSGDRVLATFTGPHAYVSPAVYRLETAAPTWNFTAVHVRGTVTKLEAGEATLDVVRATVACFEERFGAEWDDTGSVDYFRRIVPAVGAFRLVVEQAEGMFKLSQEQDPQVQDRVRCEFAARPGRHRAVAQLMARLRPARDRA